MTICSSQKFKSIKRMKKRLEWVLVMFLSLPLYLSAQKVKQEQAIPKPNVHYTGQPMANLLRGPYLQVVTSSSMLLDGELIRGQEAAFVTELLRVD